jgi:hypothetical protein
MRHLARWLLGTVLLASGCATGVDDSEDPDPSVEHEVPTGRDTSLTSPDRTRYQVDAFSWPFISYWGGPVLLGTTHIYYVWYGNWAGNAATSILTDLANGLGGSPYFNINTTYYSRPSLFGQKTYVSNSVQLAGSTTDAYSLGKSLTDANILSVVSSAISSGRLPKDTNAVYFVLTSADVTATSGFCTRYCGYHNHASIGGSDIKYSFVGNPEACPSACSAAGGSATPNGNLGADGMASIISHELEEAVTDPDLSAWADPFGQENADKCAWTFGATYTTPNGGTANMKIGGRDFLIQQNWVAGKNVCAKSYP